MVTPETSARLLKASKLAGVLFKAGCTVEDLINATPAMWEMAALAAQCHPPHSQATVDLVVKMLKQQYEWDKGEKEAAEHAKAHPIDPSKWGTEVKDE